MADPSYEQMSQARVQTAINLLKKSLQEKVTAGQLTSEQADAAEEQFLNNPDLQRSVERGEISAEQLAGSVTQTAVNDMDRSTLGMGNERYGAEKDQAAQQSQVAAALSGEDIGSLGIGDFGSFEGLEGLDFSTPPPPPTLQEQQDARFGNDLSWLDETFQQDPFAAIDSAKELGTSADPAAEQAQKDLAAEIGARGNTADPESAAAQKRAMDELFGLYEQGGLGAQDRAARAQARAESENWLKGQRDASRQRLASKGQLGSGADVLMELGDSQGAASRLSSADLQASADAERRAMDALLGGADLATGMRDSSDRYKQSNTALQGGLLTDIRNSGDRYVQDNSDRIAKIASDNKNYLRDARQKMLDERTDWQKYVTDKQVGIAAGQQARDDAQHGAGYGYSQDVAGTDVAATNNAQGTFNANTQGAFSGASPAVQGAGQTVVGLTGAPQAHAGEAFTGAANAVASIYGGALSGGSRRQTEKTGKKE